MYGIIMEGEEMEWDGEDNDLRKSKYLTWNNLGKIWALSLYAWDLKTQSQPDELQMCVVVSQNQIKFSWVIQIYTLHNLTLRVPNLPTP